MKFFLVKLLYHVKKSATDWLKTASKRAIQKTAKSTSDLIGTKIADKITKVLKNSEMIIQRQLQTRMIKKYLNGIMEYQKIINLSDNASNQHHKFRTKNWFEISWDKWLR